MSEARPKLFLSGPFQIIANDGRNATPPSTKAKALIALVLLSKNSVRSRSWLQDKLWSESAPMQGGASFRKELSKLSKHFDDFGLNFLQISRDTVSVDIDSVEVDLFDERRPPRRGELLEGLDVGDQEFEDWLALHRQPVLELLVTDIEPF